MLLMAAMVSASVQKIEAQVLEVRMDTTSSEMGDTVSLPVTVRNFEGILSAQGSVWFDTSVVSFNSLSGFGLPSMSAGNFGTGQSANGILTFSWSHPALQPVTLADDSMIFRIWFVITGVPGDTGAVRFSDSPVFLEFADSNFVTVPFDTFSGFVAVSDTIIPVFQPADYSEVSFRVYPNPFTDHFFIDCGPCGEMQVIATDNLGRAVGLHHDLSPLPASYHDLSSLPPLHRYAWRGGIGGYEPFYPPLAKSNEVGEGICFLTIICDQKTYSLKLINQRPD